MTNEYDDAYPLWDGTDYTNSISERNTMKYHMPKPSRRGQGAEPYFSEYQMQSAFDAGRMTGIEEAAEVIDDECRERIMTASDCADAIRNLKETPCV